MNFMKFLTSLVAKNHRCWAPPGLVPGGDSSRVQVWAPCGAQAQRRSVCVCGGVPAPLASAEISGQIGGGRVLSAGTPGYPRTPRWLPRGVPRSPGGLHAGRSGAHSPDAHPVRQQKRGRPCRLARPQPSAVTFQRLTQAAGRGARRRRWRPSRPGGGTRKLPPRLEPPCNRRRPEPSRGPQRPTRHGGRGRRRGLCCGAEDHGR